LIPDTRHDKIKSVFERINNMFAAVDTIAHFFIPGHSNNHRAKLLHSSSILLVVFALIIYQITLQFMPSYGVDILGYAANIPTSEVISLTNQKRQEHGLVALRENSLLAQAALAKGNDMLEKDYWAHVSPDGTQPWKFFSDVGYSYQYAGENLARDFSNATAAVDAWMASPSHKDNLLSGNYEEVGIAVVEGDLNGVDTTIIVQLFGKSFSSSPQLASNEGAGVAGESGEIQPTPIPTAVETLSPTAVPTQEPTSILTPQPSITVAPIAEVQEKAGSATPRVLISPFTTTKGMSVAIVIILLGVLVVDEIVIHRRKVRRIGGRTFAHLAFLGMILAIAIIAHSGTIL
jgi:hypothetical protein